MPYLKIPDVARRLDISEKTARRYVKAGLIPSAFIGGAYRISEEALDKYVRNAQVGAGADSPKKAQAPLPLEVVPAEGQAAGYETSRELEGPYTPGRLRAKNGVPPQVILWVGPYEVEIDNRKLSWRDAKGVSDWLAGVRGLVGSGRLSPEDAPEHFYEGMLILDSIVESMPLGHADTAAQARMEVEAVRNAFVASCAALNEIFSTAGAVEDLSPREQQRLLDTIKLTGSITFDLNLRGVGVSREGRKAEERYRNQIASLAGRLSA